MSFFKSFFSKDKINAFLVHFALSLLIFIVLLYLIVFEWYPEPLFKTDGGWQGIRLIAFVDIILGPVLTLIVFKKAKKGLKLDLSVIATIQIVALISGVMVVYNEHPVAIIVLNGRLHPITAYQIKQAGMELSKLKKYSNLKPPLIYSNIPSDADEYSELLKDSLSSGRGIRLYGEYYEKWNEHNKLRVSQNSMSIKKFLHGKPKDQLVYNKFINNIDYKGHSFIYLPLYSRYKYGIAVLDENLFKIVAVLNINPPFSREDLDIRI